MGRYVTRALTRVTAAVIKPFSRTEPRSTPYITPPVLPIQLGAGGVRHRLLPMDVPLLKHIRTDQEER